METTMNDLWGTVIQCVFWYFVIKIVMHFVIIYIQNKLELERQMIQYCNEITHQVEIESAGNVQYWFDKDTKQFIAQGTTRAEIISVLKSQWHNHLFLVTDTELLAGPDFNPVDPNIKESECLIDRRYREL
jgi:hypothetical protein